MRKRQTFLLTVLTPENGNASFCGQIKVIASGKTFTFTCLEDFRRLIATEMSEEREAPYAPLDLSKNCEDASISTSGVSQPS